MGPQAKASRHAEASYIVQRYAERRPRSKEIFERLREVLPGGETRSVAYYSPFPAVIVEGAGAVIRDADGHEYIDVLNNYTSLVHGHASPAITRAIKRSVATGTAFPAPTPPLLEFTELLARRFTSLERVRLTNSGTEAAMLALRIARAATGRRRILLFEGGYHGTAVPFAGPDPDAVRVPYNDASAVTRALDSSIAAVFIEPFMGSAGVIPAAPGFVDAVAEAARGAGALTVLDEVQSARNAYHGVQAFLATAPDLVLLGKIIGGGLPIGAVGGREDVMRLTAADSGTVAHSGTFNGNSASIAAGLASLQALDESRINELNARAKGLAASIEAAGRAAEVPCTVARAGSIMHVHLRRSAPVKSGQDSKKHASFVSSLHLALMDQGVYAAPRGMLNLSTALSDEQILSVGAAYERALAELSVMEQLFSGRSRGIERCFGV